MSGHIHRTAALREESDALIEQIMPLLAGRHPALQGIVVLELLAMWLAGHHPMLRDRMLKLQLDALPTLVEHWHEHLRGGLDSEASDDQS